MAVYQGGNDLLPRVRKQCFAKNGTPLRPHKQNDMLKKLHVRLGCYNFHHIPIGFYYAKRSEKLEFHLARAGRQDRSLSSTSRTRTSSPSPVQARSPSPPGKEAKSPNIQPLAAALDASIEGIDDSIIDDAIRSIDELRSLRAAIFNDNQQWEIDEEE